MASPFDYVPEELKREAAEESSHIDGSAQKQAKSAESSPAESTESAQPKGKGKGKSKGKSVTKRTCATKELSRQQVKEIKAARKQLRRDMKKQHIYTRREFELMASEMGYYFDKGSLAALFKWLLHGKGLLALAGSMAALMAVMVIMSYVGQLRGHFTVNLSDELFNAGFLMSETEDFANPTTHLFSAPAEDVPCVSISDFSADIDQVDGSHNEDYFAYTYYVRNEGEESVNYDWFVTLNSESKDLSCAAWLMVFEDGVLRIYAEKSAATGEAEALPATSDDTRGYPNPVLRQYLADQDQYQLIRSVGNVSYYRVVPYTYKDADTLATGSQTDVKPGDAHKYTVVMWLEGDDPDCTDALIGGHMGVEMDIKIHSDDDEVKENWLDSFLGGLRFWGQK